MPSNNGNIKTLSWVYLLNYKMFDRKMLQLHLIFVIFCNIASNADHLNKHETHTMNSVLT